MYKEYYKNSTSHIIFCMYKLLIDIYIHQASFNFLNKQLHHHFTQYVYAMSMFLSDIRFPSLVYREILCRTKTKPNNNKTCKLCSLEKYEIEKTEKKLCH